MLLFVVALSTTQTFALQTETPGLNVLIHGSLRPSNVMTVKELVPCQATLIFFCSRKIAS
jgi:hypothetical protein